MSNIAEKLTTIAENQQKLYDKGKSDEQLENWNNMTKDGIGAHCFSGSIWNDVTFSPKSNIVPASCNWFFSSNNITDLVNILECNNVTLDTSQAENMAYSFYGCQKLTRLPTINYSKVDALGRMTYSIAGCPKLEYIDALIFPEEYATSTAASPTILASLPNLVAIGEIQGKIKFNLDMSKSTVISESTMAFICEHLYDFTKNDTGFANKLTIKFAADRWVVLEAMGAPEGFSSWKEYVTSIGWIVA
ncbi:MAG: hypothetical protein J6B23_09005 [Clostridia bacterium]|nr:hypothetical protein [Clostridia bacterium]